MSVDPVNLVWQDFETKAHLNRDAEYKQLAIRACFIAVHKPGLCCTDFCVEFFKNFSDHYKSYFPVRMLIGPGAGDSYTHEAVGILSKTTREIKAVFDPIRNALGGQTNASVASSNDRYSLEKWLRYKSRLHHQIFDITDPNFYNRPFCIYMTNSDYKKGGNSSYTVVKPFLN